MKYVVIMAIIACTLILVGCASVIGMWMWAAITVPYKIIKARHIGRGWERFALWMEILGPFTMMVTTIILVFIAFYVAPHIRYDDSY